MTVNTQFFRRLALTGYLGLLIWVPVWHFFLSQGIEKSSLFIVLLWILPLLLPARGLFKDNTYTYAWANFIVMIYLLHGLTSVYAVENEAWYAVIELVFATFMFIGCSFYARLRGKELGLGIKKLKQEMAEEKARFEGD